MRDPADPTQAQVEFAPKEGDAAAGAAAVGLFTTRRGVVVVPPHPAIRTAMAVSTAAIGTRVRLIYVPPCSPGSRAVVRDRSVWLTTCQAGTVDPQLIEVSVLVALPAGVHSSDGTPIRSHGLLAVSSRWRPAPCACMAGLGRARTRPRRGRRRPASSSIPAPPSKTLLTDPAAAAAPWARGLPEGASRRPDHRRVRRCNRLRPGRVGGAHLRPVPEPTGRAGTP